MHTLGCGGARTFLGVGAYPVARGRELGRLGRGQQQAERAEVRRPQLHLLAQVGLRGGGAGSRGRGVFAPFRKFEPTGERTL